MQAEVLLVYNFGNNSSLGTLFLPKKLNISQFSYVKQSKLLVQKTIYKALLLLYNISFHS
jgi:hypothetical protein